MSTHHPIVLETETTGAVSACVPGLTVYAAADTHAAAERAVRAQLVGNLDAHPASQPGTPVRVARVSDKSKIDVVVVAALVGASRSPDKAAASCADGCLGSRPPKSSGGRAPRRGSSR